MNGLLGAAAGVICGLENAAIAALVADGYRAAFHYGGRVLNLAVEKAAEIHEDAPALDRNHAGNVVAELGILAVGALASDKSEAFFNVLVPVADGNAERATLSIVVSKS